VATRDRRGHKFNLIFTMQNLTEKYRPKTLADIRGHDLIVRLLQSFCRKPTEKAFIFSGPAGCGKTSAAYAIARELGCDMTVTPLAVGGCYEVASGELTADTVREMFKTSLCYRPMFGSGWKVLICNEADAMSHAASVIFLDILEHLPKKTIVIFTTNSPEKFEGRLKQRCECHAFKTPVRGFEQTESPAELAAQRLIDEVWMSELGHNHSPRLGDLDGWKENGNLSFRSVLSALDPLIRLQREEDEHQAELERAQLAARLPELPPGEKPRFNAGEIMRRIAAAVSCGDFETAKQLEAMAA
jgi:replication-associated recombination protein RarA